MSDRVMVLNRVDKVLKGESQNSVTKLKGRKKIYEIKIQRRPGYRVYFAFCKDRDTLLLLTGGRKKTQKQDIEKATEYWNSYDSST